MRRRAARRLATHLQPLAAEFFLDLANAADVPEVNVAVEISRHNAVPSAAKECEQ
jgi:hypothetical protein